MPSVVVPAHNEERVIGRLLSALLGQPSADTAAGGHRGEDGDGAVHAPTALEIIVIANGCDDATAAVAAGFAGVRVIETPIASKSAALRLGDELASRFPRLYVDADVVITAGDVHRLCRALAEPGVHAAGPERDLPMDGVVSPVRWYYDVWQRLPAVRAELFGRGVIAVDDEGHRRLAAFHRSAETVMADDLMIAMAFSADERVVVRDASVRIWPPRTYADLLRRRVRAMTGNARLANGGPGPAAEHTQRRPAPRTGIRELLRVLVAEPGLARRMVMAHKVALFLGTAVVARLRARRASRTRDPVWLRDESSRTFPSAGDGGDL